VQETNGKTFDLKVHLEVVGEEDVEVPAGKMRGIKVIRVTQWSLRDGKQAGTNTFTYWYNANVKRFILGETTNVTDKGKLLQHERQELVSYLVK